ncbi:DUF6665 family protein [Polymorphum gilvum]|uniref:Uncharacterized protein n=1 Tax=Polymorphum gilvum (strain LMG 25793 / CGMCC 1.9160 / SL003B-26A1) TaxID=991905 RepID=F2J0J1_POLGS|nr:DUF6665 family protein [Polymorphum gilvum]ADZ69658.1 hypothetical protein SL003B_1230 [Polymorphum gilvum SL003B-26A1]
MSIRPPKQLSDAAQDPLAAALQHEAMAEKAGTLARLTGKLEAALAALAETEARLAAAGDDVPRLEARREERLALAGEALWHVVIQRELCGLRRHGAFLDHMGVPKPVRLRMGPAVIPAKG